MWNVLVLIEHVELNYTQPIGFFLKNIMTSRIFYASSCMSSTSFVTNLTNKEHRGVQ